MLKIWYTSLSSILKVTLILRPRQAWGLLSALYIRLSDLSDCSICANNNFLGRGIKVIFCFKATNYNIYGLLLFDDLRS